MESIYVVIDDAAGPSVFSTDNEKNSSIPPSIKTDAPNIHSDISPEVISKSSMKANQPVVKHA